MNLLHRILQWPVQATRVWAREWKLFFSDKAVVIFSVLLCLTYPVLYSLIYNPEVANDVKVVVVDDCRSDLSRQVARELDATSEVMVAGYAADMHEAQRLLHEKQAYGIVVIPRDFSSNIHSGRQGHISLYCDMGVMIRYKQMLSALTAVQQHITGSLAAAKIGILTYQTGSIVESQEVAIVNPGKGIASAVLPGVLVAVIQQSIVLVACCLRAGSRERRLRNRGFDPKEITASPSATVVGKSLCYSMAYVLLGIYVLHYVPMMFDFPQMSNPWEVIYFMVPLVLASTMLGQVLSIFVSERESTFLVIAFSSVIFVFLAGISWPRALMSPVWTALGNAIPLTWGASGYIAMHSAGATLGQVHQQYVMLWVLTIGWGIVAWLVERFISRPRWNRMKWYAERDPMSPLIEEYRRNGVDMPHSPTTAG